MKKCVACGGSGVSSNGYNCPICNKNGEINKVIKPKEVNKMAKKKVVKKVVKKPVKKPVKKQVEVKKVEKKESNYKLSNSTWIKEKHSLSQVEINKLTVEEFNRKPYYTKFFAVTAIFNIALLKQIAATNGKRIKLKAEKKIARLEKKKNAE